MCLLPILSWIPSALAGDYDEDATCGEAHGPHDQPNLLLVTLDDWGRDKLLLYGEPAANEIRIPTPAIDGLAAKGVTFTRAWAHATCSPTRGSVLTGQYPSRNGLRTAIAPGSPAGLDPALPHLLPRRLSQAGYTAAMVGKWHATSWAPGAESGPLLAGFDAWTGFIGSHLTDGMATTIQYYLTPPLRCDEAGTCAPAAGWLTTLAYEPDGVTLTAPLSAQYETTDQVDQALAWLQVQEHGNGNGPPWFLWLSLQAPHSPYVLPPARLLDPALVAQIEAKTGVPYQEGQRFTSLDGVGQRAPRKADTYEARAAYAAMVAATDTELDRLFDQLDFDDTFVILLGDNGTPDDTTDEDRPGFPLGDAHQRAKGTIYEGGIGVPFLVRGPGIRSKGRISEALVHTTDLYVTLLELAGVDASSAGVPIDGETFLPSLCADDPGVSQRQFVYSEQRNGSGTNVSDAVADARYKLVHQTLSSVPSVALYDLQLDPTEQHDLLLGTLTPEAQLAYQALEAYRSTIRASFP
jgi:arylsulfatase A-like enzyme